MNTAGGSLVQEVLPHEAWAELEEDPRAALIDVRTRPEWMFVGVPDLSGVGKSTVFVEWRRFPDMAVNPAFVDELLQTFEQPLPEKLFFICRSGSRSMEAALAVQAELDRRGVPVACFNVGEGFEGDLDAEGHRGSENGWKARALPWRQT